LVAATGRAGQFVVPNDSRPLNPRLPPLFDRPKTPLEISRAA
jgi:hypothetical protein